MLIRSLVSSLSACLLALTVAEAAPPASMRFAEEDQTQSISNAQTFYGSGTTHTLGYGSGRSEELKSLAFGLGYDASNIYDYVRDNIEIHPTFGLSKGAFGANFDKSGTSFDQAHLLYELLDEAADNGAPITSIRYRIGSLTLTGAEFEEWFGVSNASDACYLLANGGIPGKINNSSTCANLGGGISTAELMHIWVTATVDGASKVFDPSYKPSAARTLYRRELSSLDAGHAYLAPFNLNGTTWKDALPANCKNTSLLTSAGPNQSGVVSGVDYVQDFDNDAVKSRLQTCSDALWNWVEANAPEASLGDLLGKRVIIPAMGANTSLPLGKYSTNRTLTVIPDQYRTKLTLKYGMHPVLELIDLQFFADEIYGKRLALEPNGFEEVDTPYTWSAPDTVCGGGNSAYNYHVRVSLDGAYLGDGFTANCTPTQRGGFSDLSLDLPYAASAGSYQDTTYSYPITLVTRAVVGLGLGEYSSDMERQYTKGLGLDRSTFWVRETGMNCPGECDPPDSISYGSRLQENARYRLFAAWAKQFSQATELVSLTTQTLSTHHYSLGWSSAETTVQWRSESTQAGAPLSPNNEFSIGSEGITLSMVSSLSNSSASSNAVPARRMLANLGSTLEASVFEQQFDSTASSGVANKFEWANLATRNTPSYGTHYGTDPQGAMKFYDLAINTTVSALELIMTSDGLDVCDGLDPALKCFESGYNTFLQTYSQLGFEITASQDAHLGPGLRCGFSIPSGNVSFGGGGGISGQVGNTAVTSPAGGAASGGGSGTTGGGSSSTLYRCMANSSRGSAFIAYKPDWSEIAYISASPYKFSKGGGSGQAGPEEFASLEAPTPADAFKPSSEISYAHNVDLKTGTLSYSDGGLISTGSGSFPNSLSFSRSMNSGQIGYDDPVWNSSWHMPLTISGSGSDRLGSSRGLFATPTLATVALLEAIYAAPNNDTERLKQDVIGALAASWWSDQLTHNTVSASFGGTASQFVRKPGTQVFWPASGGLSRVVQTGERTLGQPDRIKPDALPTTMMWKLDGVSFQLTTADKQIIDYGFWKSWYLDYGQTENSITPGDFLGSDPGEKSGFHATNWSFPTGVSVNLNYTHDQSCFWGGNCSKPYLTSVSNTFGHQLDFTGLAENPQSVSVPNGPSIQLSDTKVVQADNSETLYAFSEDTGCAKLSTLSGSSALAQDCIPYRHGIYLDVIRKPGDTATSSFMTFDYDAADKVRSFKDARGELWTYLVGGGRYAQTLDPLQNASTVYYYDGGRFSRSIDAIGNEAQSYSDGLGRAALSKLYDPAGAVFSESYVNYDAIGNVLEEGQVRTPYNALGAIYGYESIVQNYAYEDSTWPNKPTKIFQPRYQDANNKDEGATLLFYDGQSGQLELQVTPASYCTTATANYDVARDFSVEQSGVTENVAVLDFFRCKVSAFEYDGLGRVTQILASQALHRHDHSSSSERDKAWIETLVSYHPIGSASRGDLHTVTTGAPGEELQRTSIYSWDSIGNLLSITDNAGVDSTAEYDVLRRLTKVLTPEGGESRYAFDTRGRLRAISQKIGANSWAIHQAEYYPNGAIKQTSDPDGDITLYTYDAAGRLDATTDGAGRQTKSLYYPNGQVKCTLSAYGTSLQQAYAAYEYGPDGQVSRQRPAKGSNSQTCAKLNSEYDTIYTYDEFRRLFETTFPARAEDAGSSYVNGVGQTYVRQWLDQSGFTYLTRTRAGELIEQWTSTTGNTFRRITAAGANNPQQLYFFQTYGDGTPFYYEVRDRVGNDYP
ncbi:MAG: hypothetical protein ABNH53_09020, partial [Henriciella sp.]